MKPNLSESVWTHKPWWCQPWSIILTGCSIIAAIVYFIPWLWAKIVFSFPFALWMVYFTVLYPKMMQEYLQQQSK